MRRSTYPLVVALAITAIGLPLAAPSVAEPPQVRYMPQATGQVDDFRLGPAGGMVVTSSIHGATRVWTRGQLRHVVPGHVAAVSHDGRWIATGTSFQHRSGAVRLFSATDARLHSEWDTGPIRVIDFSLDGRYLVSGGWDGRVHLWDLTRGELLHRWDLESQWLTSVAVSPDHEFVAASSSKRALAWDLRSGTRRFQIDQHENWVETCLVSPDSAWVVTASHDGTARIHDADRGKTLAVLDHGDEIRAAALSQDGRRVVTGGSGTVQVWNAQTGKREHTIEVDRISSLAVAADSRWVAVGTSDSSAYGFDLQTGERIGGFASLPFAARVHFSPDGKVLGVGRAGFDLYDVASRTRLLNVLPHRAQALRLEFSPEGRYLLASYRSRGTAVWDLAGTDAPFRTDGKHGRWTGHRAYFLAGGECCGGRVRLWDAESRRLVAELEDRVPISYVAAAPDGSILATASEAGGVRVWGGLDGQPQAELITPRSNPRTLEVPSPDLVAAGYDDGLVALWKAGQAEPWRTFHHEVRERVSALTSSADHGLLASAASNERKLMVWNLAGGPHRALPGPSGALLHRLVFTPDGGKIVSAWGRPDLVTWDLETGTMRMVAAGQGEATSLAISPNGGWIASGDSSGEVRLWDAEGSEPRVFRGLAPRVSAVAIDPRGRWLAGADSDGITLVWDLQTGRELVRLSTLPDGGWAATSADGRWDAAHQGRVSGIVAWDRGFATALVNVPQYRTPGLLQEVMAPWRSSAVEAVAEESPPVSTSPLPGAWAGTSSRSETTECRIDFERVASLQLPRGAGVLNVRGRHAAVGTGDGGVQLVDLADLEHPVLGRTVRLGGITRDVELTADHLFVTNSERFFSFEISADMEPGQSAVLDGESSWGFAVQGGHVFLADVVGGFRVVDIESPLRPQILTSLSRSTPPGGRTVVLVKDDVAYVGGSLNSQAGLELIDISDPTRPRILSSFVVPGNSIRDLELHGNHLLAAAGNGGLVVYDVTEPRHVEQISQYDSVDLYGVLRVGDKAFLADSVEGLLVVDLVDPKNPTLIGQLASAELGEEARARDVVALDDGLLLVSLGKPGLQILRWSETD